MARGKKVVPDFIAAGSSEPRTGDPTDDYLSSTDIGQDFTQNTDITKNPSENPTIQ